MPEMPPPTLSVADVAAIAATAEPILRNHRITVGYWQLARALHARLPEGANWCAFGTWASRQAGCSIRKEDVERAVARRLRAKLEGRLVLREMHQLLRIPEQRVARVAGALSQGLPGIDRAADALARGNQLIFAEIGQEYARYLSGDTAAFGDALRAGPAPTGQDLLRSAFGHYTRAGAAPAPVARAQCILLANVQIALHEQTMAQPLIREAMDASLLDIVEVRRLVLARLEELVANSPIGSLHTSTATRVLYAAAEEISEALRAVVRMVITERMMGIELPGDRRLRLGTDVIGAFPASLRSVADPELQRQLAQLDATPDSTAGSGTRDWANLSDRMHYLVDFFRCYQEDASLFDPPFTEDQLAAIAGGQSPELS